MTSTFVLRRAAGLAPAALFLLALFIPSAPAQGIFESLLGPTKAAYELPPAVHSYAEPLPLSAPAMESRPAADAVATSTAYCVRLCDGRFFPIQRNASISPAEQCRALCPAAKTKILSGTSINNAVAADGTRYTNLSTAFLFRTRLVDGCTCNGRDAFGTASMDIATDPTLRPGDLVATDHGFAAYTGGKTKTAFTPIEKYPGLSGETRQRLAQTRVTPLPPKTKAPATIATNGKTEADLTRRPDRRAQLFR